MIFPKEAKNMASNATIRMEQLTKAKKLLMNLQRKKTEKPDRTQPDFWKKLSGTLSKKATRQKN